MSTKDQLLTEKLEEFFGKYKSRVYPSGQIILYPNKNITHVYYINSGYVKQFILSPDGDKLTLHIYKPHCYIPFALLLSKAPNKYTYQAIGNTEVTAAPVKNVDEFIKSHPELLYDLSYRLSSAVAYLLYKIEQSAFDDVHTRIISLLATLAERFGQNHDGERHITLPLTHVDIASWLGVHRETVSRRLTELQKNGIIKYNNQHIILTDKAINQWELGNN